MYHLNRLSFVSFRLGGSMEEGNEGVVRMLELFNKTSLHSFDDVILTMLERGGVGFLSLDVVLFIWDQGFIGGKYEYTK